MYYIAVYDIISDRVRQKIVKELNRWGNRVQKSVFEIFIYPRDLEKMKKRIQPYLENNDSFRLYLKDRSRNTYLGNNEVEFILKRYEVD
ncbi:MAG: CRISPR-associated endonuclease Cas2 [Candidatus Marinimicrobia bacterium]|nr:CRISPR-associated endonuclease Cas2 [Candidatus Neomarinimicrobiota bacterium]